MKIGIYCQFLVLFIGMILLAQEDIPSPESDKEIVQIKIVPDSVILKPGEKIRFSFIAMDRYGKEIPAAFIWTFSGGSLKQDGSYTAGNRPGKYTLEAAISTGIKGVAHITIVGADPEAAKIEKITITPSHVVMKSGESQYFRFAAYDKMGNKLSVPFQISFSGGKFYPDGKFIAGERPGKYLLTAASPDGIKAHAEIVIEGKDSSPKTDNSSAPIRVSIHPKRIRIRPGGECHFRFEVKDSMGQNAPAQITLSYRGGILTTDGRFRAGMATGQYYITLKEASGLSDRAIVAVVPDPESDKDRFWIELSPDQISLKPGEICRFTIRIEDEQGKRIHLPLQWDYLGGTFDPLNLTFTAGEEIGDYYLEAIISEHVRARASIKIQE